MSKTTARGFFEPEADEGSTCPASAEEALIRLLLLWGLNGRQGMQFKELPRRVITDEDKALGSVETCTRGFPTIVDKTS
uniref:Uncharacterized protein n=1 Tax=Lotus japonicus TaxID=34305 RepID=I3SGF3_LOTJA|nr:unknown [Lotus japonicus]